LGDVLVLYFSLFATLLIRYGTLSNIPLFRVHFVPFSILFVFWLIIFYIYKFYDLTSAKNTLDFYTTLLRTMAVNFGLAVFFFYFIPLFAITPKRNLFIFLLVFTLLFSLWRQITNRTLKNHLKNNTVVLGAGARAMDLAKTLIASPQIGYKVVAIFLRKKSGLDIPQSLPVATTRDFPDLANTIRKFSVNTIVVEKGILKNERVFKSLHTILNKNIGVVDLDEFEESLKRKVRLEDIDEIWFLHHVARGRRITYDFFKRILDVVISALFIPPSIVLGVLIAALIKIEDGGPVFYTQVRFGENIKPFNMLKFRTMHTDAEIKGARWTVQNDSRITRVGKFLRLTRLDELPQIINILKGEMAFVGPRAERPEFHNMLKSNLSFYENRYLIRPGLTGWAQINYTYGSSVEDTRQKLAYDFYYLKKRSLIFDIGIILRTIELVLGRRGR